MSEKDSTRETTIDLRLVLFGDIVDDENNNYDFFYSSSTQSSKLIVKTFFCRIICGEKKDPKENNI